LIVAFLLISTASLLMPKLAPTSWLFVTLLDYLTLLCCCGCLDMHQQPLPALLCNNRQLDNVANCFPPGVAIPLLLLSCCAATAVSGATTF